MIAEGYPWRPGDNVVTAAEEYPSNIYPWMNLESRGVSLRLVPSREAGSGSRPGRRHRPLDRVLAISHVEFASGFRNDLERSGRALPGPRRRAFRRRDPGARAARPSTCDRTPIDFLAADGHKWLLGPEGAGILYVRRDWIDRLRPTGVGWHSVVGSYNSPRNDFVLKPSAQRWEGGSFNMAGLLAFGASLGLFLELGPDGGLATHPGPGGGGPRAGRLCRLDGLRLDARPTTDRRSWCSNTGASIPPAPLASSAAKGSSSPCRRGRLRVSPHLYNNRDDLERLRAGLVSLG